MSPPNPEPASYSRSIVCCEICCQYVWWCWDVVASLIIVLTTQGAVMLQGYWRGMSLIILCARVWRRLCVDFFID